MRTPFPNEPTPCIHVLAFDRPASLQQLLNQLNDLDYGSSRGRIWLHISIDRPARVKTAAPRWNLVQHSLALANNFSFAAGCKTVRMRRHHAGLTGQWLHSWRPDKDTRDYHRACVLLEDDNVPSRYAWQWTMNALQAYGNETDIASFAWNRPTLVASQTSRTSGRMPPPGPDQNPFLYKLMSTWGFVALRRSWMCFLRWSETSMHLAEKVLHNGSLIQPEVWYARKPQGRVWSVHFIRFMDIHGLFTLYPNINARRALCANTRAAGLNFNRNLGPEFAPLRPGDSLLALTSFPPAHKLRYYDWNALSCMRCFDSIAAKARSYSCCYSRSRHACSSVGPAMNTPHQVSGMTFGLASFLPHSWSSGASMVVIASLLALLILYSLSSS